MALAGEFSRSYRMARPDVTLPVALFVQLAKWCAWVRQGKCRSAVSTALAPETIFSNRSFSCILVHARTIGTACAWPQPTAKLSNSASPRSTGGDQASPAIPGSAALSVHGRRNYSRPTRVGRWPHGKIGFGGRSFRRRSAAQHVPQILFSHEDFSTRRWPACLCRILLPPIVR